MSTILEEEFEEPVFVPYGFLPEVGDCADAAHMANVNKVGYADQFAFVLAGRLMVKHAP